MTENRPGAQPRPFGADELDDVSGLRPDELAADTRLARELEATAARVSVRPSADFTDRVMAAVAKEPVAAPARAARVALRHGAFGAFLISLRDAWRVTVSPAFPMAMRAQAMVMVLVVAGLAAGAGAVTAGALGLFDGDRSTQRPSPTLETSGPSPVVTESPTERPASLEPSPSPEPSPSDGDASAEPSESADPSESAEPAETNEAAGTASPTKRPSPTRTPSPTWTPLPTPSPTPDGEHDGEPTHTPDPTEAPYPSPTPRPSETPH